MSALLAPALLAPALLAPALPALLAAACWVPPVEGPIVVAFAEPPCAYCPGQRGVEFAVGDGVAVRAVAGGEVTFAGTVAGTRYVVVRQADGWRATYGRLDALAVRRGAVVDAGTPIGTASGRMYFGVREAEALGGDYLDPTPLLGQFVRRPWLVPTDGSAGRRGPPPRLRCPGG